MRFNDRELIELSNGDADLEGALFYKKTGAGTRQHRAFKERWFKLKFNLLFYYDILDDKKGKFVGAFILEQCLATPSMTSPLVFSLKFEDDLEVEHLFSGSDEDLVTHWITALNRAGYYRWRTRLAQLQAQMISLTGEDPLLKLGYQNYRSNTGVSSKPKTKKTSFKSYVNTSSGDLGLEFHEDHFGNGLEAIGGPLKVSLGDTRKMVESTNVPVPLEQLTLNGDGNNEDSSTARPRPRPTRKAPDPPTRPPRGLRKNPAPSNDNLIDL